MRLTELPEADREAGGVLLGRYRGPHIEIMSCTTPLPEDLRTRFGLVRQDKGHLKVLTAWGPGADQRSKLLIYQAMEGPILDAYLKPRRSCRSPTGRSQSRRQVQISIPFGASKWLEVVIE
jgi:hypothetical protein